MPAPPSPARPSRSPSPSRRRVDREVVALIGVIAAFVAVQGWLAGTVDQALDADGQVVRAVNRWAALRWGDAVFHTQVGLPSWAQPGHEVMATQSPYPPGYPAAMVPVVALSGGDVLAVRLASLAWVTAGLAGLAVAARSLLGRWGALAAVALVVGSPVIGGVARAASIDSVAVAFVLGGAAVALRSEALGRRGSGLALGALTALGLVVKWTVLLPLLPAWAAVAVPIAARSRGHAAGVATLAAIGAAVIATVGVATRGALPAPVAWGVPWGAAAVALGVGQLPSRGLGDPALARLAVAVACVCGPGLAWYTASGEVLAAYLHGNDIEVERVGIDVVLKYGYRFLAVGLWGGPAWAALGLLAARWTPRPLATAAFVTTGALACGLLCATGSPWTFDGGVVATRQFQMFLPWVALGAGAVVVALPVRARPVLASLLAVVGLLGATSPAWSACRPAAADRDLYRVCAMLPVPGWGVVPTDRRLSLGLPEVLPAVEGRPRVTAVLVRDFRRIPPDEAEYLRALVVGHRALTLVDEPGDRVADWVRRYADRVDDLVLIDVRVDAQALAAGGFPAEPVRLPIPGRRHPALLYTGPGRTVDVPPPP